MYPDPLGLQVLEPAKDLIPEFWESNNLTGWEGLEGARKKDQSNK